MSVSHRDDRPALVALGLILAAIVLVSALGLLSRYLPSNPETYADGGGTQASYGERGPAEGYWMPEASARDTYAQWAMTGLAFVATVISVIGVFLLRKTFIETKRTADVATSQLRPWVYVRDFEVTDVALMNVGGQWALLLGWQYDIVNTGASAALNVTSDVLVFPNSISSLRTIEFERRGIEQFNPDGGWAVAPGSVFHRSDSQASRVPTPDDDGGMPLWVSIVVTYKGAIDGEVRQTTQTFWINENQAGPSARNFMRVQDLKLGRANPKVEQLGRSRMS